MSTWHGEERPSARVYAIALRNDHILLVKARQRDRNDPEVWWLPGGGVDFLESPEDALRREVLEETGLHLLEHELLGVLSDTWFRRNGQQVHAIRIVYRVRVDEGEVRHEADGSTSEARWVPLGDLDSIELAPYVRTALSYTK